MGTQSPAPDRAAEEAAPSPLTPEQRELIARRSVDTDSPGAGDRFRNLLQAVVTVPKEEIDRRESEAKKGRAKCG